MGNTSDANGDYTKDHKNIYNYNKKCEIKLAFMSKMTISNNNS